jgi:hypothetical protein
MAKAAANSKKKLDELEEIEDIKDDKSFISRVKLIIYNNL